MATKPDAIPIQVAAITAGLTQMFGDPRAAGEIREIRVLNYDDGNSRSKTLSGYFTDFVAAGANLASLSRHYNGAYITLNPCLPALLARGKPNILSPVRGALTTAPDIVKRTRLLIDCDPVRPGAVSSTDAEHEAAKARALEIRDWLKRERGWGPPAAVIDSGNGAHLIYAIDEPNDTNTRNLVSLVLRVLAKRFDDSRVTIDTSTFDANRITKIPGTFVRKGTDYREGIAETWRPWRVAGVIDTTTTTTLVTVAAISHEQLAALAAEYTPPAPAPAPATSAPPPAGQSTRGRGRPRQSLVPSRDQILERAWNYLDKIPRAISGQGGHKQTYHAAATIVIHFDLSIDDARPLLQRWNEGCQPPWDDKDLDHKLESANESDEPRGKFLRDWDGKRGRWKTTNVDPSRNGHAAGSAHDVAGQSTDGEAGAGDSDLPVIVVSHRRHESVSQAISALADDERIYQQGTRLVRIVRDNSSARVSGVTLSEGAPAVVDVLPAYLSDRITEIADLVQEKWTKEGTVDSPVHPPNWLADSILARCEWPGIRPLTAVVETPILRRDGTVLDQPGYDTSTGILFEPLTQFSPIPLNPARADAEAALAELLDVFVDFPFATPADSSAVISWILTPLARFAFAGCCPLFLVDANVQGVGKGKILDVISLITTGRSLAKSNYSRDESEMRKRITAIAASGVRYCCWDNLTGALSSSALAGAVTAEIWRDRILGQSREIEMPLWVCWSATANNLSVDADFARRTLLCRLECLEENPEERQNFRHLDLLAHVRTNRARLTVAALTILRAWIVAGRPAPPQPLTPWGSFEGWSALPRAAAAWATGVDPGETRKTLRENAVSSELDGLRAFLDTLQESDPFCHGQTAAEILKLAAKADGLPEDDLPDRLVAALAAFCPGKGTSELPSSRALGNRMRVYHRRVVSDKYLDFRTVEGNRKWFVVSKQSTENTNENTSR